MNALGDVWRNLLEFARDSEHPVNSILVIACVLALVAAPVGVAWMGTQPWFAARRGRVSRRPSFASVIVGTLLVTSIPAILLALLAKSPYYDHNRYEFDPNRVPSVFEQGRQYEGHDLQQSARALEQAEKQERERLADERKKLVEAVKKLDQAMLSLGESALTIQQTSDAMPAVVEALAQVRRSVGVDAQPRWQELVAIMNDPERRLVMATTTVAAAPNATAARPASPYARELAKVPPAQRALADLLPLDAVPTGWELGTLGDGHIETFNAENLYEKIDGRAESFSQYDVTGMAYCNFHPKGNEESGEVQLYIFEFANALKAFGKYGSEKPEDAQTVAIGSEGYASAGSVSFHGGKYFVQVVSTSDDASFAKFSTDIANAVAARIAGGKAATVAEAQPQPAEAKTADSADPTALFKLLPDGPNRQQSQYVAQDAFGYQFLTDVFLAGYKDGDATWQAFLRPYESPEAAAAVFQKYLDEAKTNGAQIEQLKADGAERMFASSDIGLFDVLFLKGNTLAGVNGATTRGPAEAFARKLAASLPAHIEPIATTKPTTNSGGDQ